MRPKTYLLIRVVGSTNCQNKRCQICYNIRKTDYFQSCHLNTEYKINHKFHCNDKCLVELLTCKVYWKKFVRQAVDRFSLRWKKYKESIRKTAKSLDHKQVYLFNNFKTEGHAWFLNDV